VSGHGAAREHDASSRNGSRLEGKQVGLAGRDSSPRFSPTAWLVRIEVRGLFDAHVECAGTREKLVTFREEVQYVTFRVIVTSCRRQYL